MKRILLTILLVATTISAFAQPRAVGLRIGVSGLEASYQHNIKRNQFVEGNLGLDFGYNANGTPGIKAEGTYNFVWARPAWTNKGSWAIYSGPGASIGHVNDMTVRKGDDGVEVLDSRARNGFMLGVSVQVGLEYTFDFPLQLAADLRPVFGMHINGKYTDPVTLVPYKARVGFYDNGMLGFVPTISVRYRF